LEAISLAGTTILEQQKRRKSAGYAIATSKQSRVRP
jgi:hypothetical protein